MKKDKIPDSESARKILEAAREEFVRFGLAGARVERIARRAKVNKAMIYYHFKSKENLYQQILEHHLSFLKRFYEEYVTPTGDPEEIFRHLARFYASMYPRIKEIMPMLLRELAEGGSIARKAFLSFGKHGPAARIKEVLDEGVRKGQFRDSDFRHTILSFVGMNMFFILMSPVAKVLLDIKDEDELAFVEQRAEAVADLFLNGLRRK